MDGQPKTSSKVFLETFFKLTIVLFTVFSLYIVVLSLVFINFVHVCACICVCLCMYLVFVLFSIF